MFFCVLMLLSFSFVESNTDSKGGEDFCALYSPPEESFTDATTRISKEVSDIIKNLPLSDSSKMRECEKRAETVLSQKVGVNIFNSIVSPYDWNRAFTLIKVTTEAFMNTGHEESRKEKKSL